MNKVDVTFVFQCGNSQNYARTKQNGVYSNEGYSVDELMTFLIDSVNKEVLRKGTKRDYGKDKKVIYEFKYKNNDINSNQNSTETIKLIIPGQNRELYKEQEQQLNSLIGINCKLRKAAVIRVAALVAAGITLVTFATIKVAKGVNEIAREIYEDDQKRAKSYIDSIKQEPTYSEEDKQKSIIADLKERAEAGDQQAIFEYNRYLASKIVEESSKIK